MDGAIIPSLASFVFAATITPGPNNIMVMASGANFGLRRSIPHLLGISVGVLLIIVLAGVGLMAIFDALPSLETVLRVVSTVYLLWLAWKIANVPPPDAGKAAGRPLSFLQAAAFQWVNPKVWATSLSAITLFAPERGVVCVVLVASAFALIGLASNAIWAWMGTALQRWLIVGRRLQFFNIAMAILLIASLYPVSQH
ncbi:LysE family translocator [Brucella grignonensis]|uniref:LysE type translocator family protein n=1 Tax=Brucella grignonensis TaxID=94627 RepID=A0A256F0A5_9HYPH|nr:LysE family translocator [Brucella grignonensis]OYR08318.1 lysE type translocator family protein [Brucella grignonensis]